MTKHISEVPLTPPPGVTFFGNATLYEPESLRAKEYKPENPALTPNEIERATVLGMTLEEAEHAKVAAYLAEAERFGAQNLGTWLGRRASMQANGLVAPGPPDWPLAPEPTDEDLAKANGMSVDAYVGMQDVHNVHDFERLQGELAHKAEIDAEARRQLELEQAKRRIAAERSGDHAA